MPTIRSKKHFSIIAALALVCIAIAVWFVLFGTSSLITKERVEKHFVDIGEQINHEAQNNGKEAKLAHGEIEIKGWGYHKYAVVHDVSIEVSEKTVTDIKKWSLSTESLGVALDPANMERVILSLPKPVNVIENSQLKTVISFNEPLRYAYLESNKDGVFTINQDVLLPNQITFGEPKTADATAPQKTGTIVSFKENPKVQIVFSPDKKSRSLDYAFSDFSITGDGGNQISIGTLISHFDEAASGDGHMVGKYTFSATNLVMHDANSTTKPYTLNLDFSYDGQQPVQLGVGDVLPRLQNANIQLNDLVFASDEFKIHADGTLHAEPEDPLLFGEAKLEVSNVQKLLASEVVPAPIRGAVEAALEKMSGQKVASMSDVSVPVKREKNGVFYIGQTTFEALATSFFSDVLTSRPSDAAPVALTPPPAEASPAAAPKP